MEIDVITTPAQQGEPAVPEAHSQDLLRVLELMCQGAGLPFDPTRAKQHLRRAEQEVSKLEKDKDRLLNSTRKSQVAVDAAKEEAITLGILAGTLPAQGPGLRITVTNQANRLTLNHLLDGIQELRDAGAEAMEFNDTVRVVASTWFDSNESGIVVDGRRLSSPYIIDVIGDPETLGPALQVPGGFVFDVESDQGTVKIEQLDKVVVGSIITLKSPDFAQPDSGQ